MMSTIRYAKSGDVHTLRIELWARVRSISPWFPGWVSHLEANWDDSGLGLRFSTRNVHTLKGVPGEWRLFAVADFLVVVVLRADRVIE